MEDYVWIRKSESRSVLYLKSFNTKPIACLDKIQCVKDRYRLSFNIPNTNFYYDEELDKFCKDFEEAEYIAINRIKWQCKNLIKKITKVTENF